MMMGENYLVLVGPGPALYCTDPTPFDAQTLTNVTGYILNEVAETLNKCRTFNFKVSDLTYAVITVTSINYPLHLFW